MNKEELIQSVITELKEFAHEYTEKEILLMDKHHALMAKTHNDRLKQLIERIKSL